MSVKKASPFPLDPLRRSSSIIALEQEEERNLCESSIIVETIEDSPPHSNCCPCLQRLIPGDGKSHPMERVWHEITCLVIPLSFCLILNVIVARVCQLTSNGSAIFYPPESLNEYSIFSSFISAAFILVGLIILTLLFLACHYYRLRVFLRIVVALFFSVANVFLLYNFLKSWCNLCKIPLDYIVLSFFIFNTVGTINCILFILENDESIKTSVNISLIFVSTALAFPFMCLNEWTVWLTLGGLAIWDLFAVLSPYGPLRYILNVEKERIVYLGEETVLPPGIMYEGEDFRLGLGDFVFFGVLVGRGSIYGLTPCVSSFFAVHFGMMLTIYVAKVGRCNVPALPISILAGILTYTIAILTAQPFLFYFDSMLFII